MVSDAQRNAIGGRSEAATPFLGWKHRGRDSVGGAVAPVSARKLAASLWRLADTAPAGGSVRWQCVDRLGFQFCSSMPIPKFVTEGATKWDCADYFESNVKLNSAAITGQSVLLKSRKHANEGGWWRTKIKYRVRASTEWCSVIKNLAEGVKSERRICKNMDKMNSNLLRDIGEAKLSATKLIRRLGKEKKAREELEDVCYDLGKEIEGRKAEIGALRNEQRRIEEGVEEERKMRQMGEVWREEQAHMKLADAKFILEDKCAEINEVIADLRAFTTRSDVDVASKVEVLRQALDSVKDLKSDKASAIIKDSERRNDGRCCSNDQAHCASIVHFISNEFRKNKSVSQAKISWSEGSVNKMRRAYMSKRKGHKGCEKSEGTEISSISLMQPKTNVSSSCRLPNGSSMPSNPHVVRAMKGHIEWPWRVQRHGGAGNLLEAKLESQKMLLRNVLKQKA